MIQNFSLHTHTIGFDGRNTPARMMACARQHGMTALGISNHFIVHPNIKKTNFYPHAVLGGYDTIYSSSFDEAIARFKPHYEELNQLSDMCDIKLYRGMEVDYFDSPEWLRGFERAMKVLKPDYVICASHFIEYDGMLCNVHDIANTDKTTQNNMLRLYWKKLGCAAETGMFNWMAHLDLPKKTGCGCGAHWADVEQVAINAIAKSKTPIEINTSGYSQTSDEPYPSSRILKMVAQTEIPVLLSDDAHCAERIGRYFVRGFDLAVSNKVYNFLTCQEAVSGR